MILAVKSATSSSFWHELEASKSATYIARTGWKGENLEPEPGGDGAA